MKEENLVAIGALYLRSPFCGDWKNGFSREAPELRSGKPGSRPDLPFEAERRISMVKLLVELPLIGKFTIIIVWHRKGRR